jgi:cytochrome c oxidase cbb3-type subunit III
MRTPLPAAPGLLGLLVLVGCDGWGRQPHEYSRMEAPPSGNVTVPYVQTTDFQAGRDVPYTRIANPFAGATAEGRLFYEAFNCSGCHGSQGGGGIGPPFLVARFIYGSEPANIFQSIVQGRPQGMPAYGGKAPDEVIWKIVAYVESLAEPHLAGGGPTAGGRDRTTAGVD